MKTMISYSLTALALVTTISAHTINPNTATVPEQTPSGCAQATKTPSSSELASAIAGCQGISDGLVRNDIIDGICKPFTLLFARGTGESGNVGNIVGPPFVLALEKTFGKENLAVQGVNDYEAIPTEYCEGGSLTGSQYLAWLVERTMVQCPETKLCVGGYSQGSQVVHNAAEILKGDEAATKFIDSVVTFGDPDHTLPVGNVPDFKWSFVCHKRDLICKNEATIKKPHLTYCHNVDEEAAFVKKRSEARGGGWS